mmetsp:Transcript_25435/g.72909  ORF Transcript_25435/g.72909 Transcript_25435/m.72909 type:complete len:884 (+) Transcript_25435:118-2769(+)
MPLFPLKRRRVAPESTEPTVTSDLADWAQQAVVHARALLARGPASGRANQQEAAALLTAVLLRVPSLWEELAQDLVLAYGSSDAGDTAARRLLLEAVVQVLPPSHRLDKRPTAAAAAAALLCLLGEAEAEEGRYIAAFRALRRSQTLARRVGHVRSEDQATAAIEGLRTAALQRWHFQMINDVERGAQYERAIAAAVRAVGNRPAVRAAGGAIALDIGTGTGLLALMCGRLRGVRHVHACEMNDALCAVAQEVIASQEEVPVGKVDVHRTVSTALQLPEKADLIFCEIFDAGLLGEHALPTILHAKEALLKEDGLLVPARAAVFGQVVESPALMERFGVVRPPSGISFASVRIRCTERYTCETLPIVPHTPLTEPVKLVTIDFREVEYLRANLGSWIDPPAELRVLRGGTAHALAFWWELELDTAGACRISSSPSNGCDSWQQAVRPLVPPVPGASGRCVQEGEVLALDVRVHLDGLEMLLRDDGGGSMGGSAAEACAKAEAGTGTAAEVAAEQRAALRLSEDELRRLNNALHWAEVRQGIDHALEDLGPHCRVQAVDASEAALPISALLAAECCQRTGAVFCGAVVGVRGDEEREALNALVQENMSSSLADQVSVLIASPLQVLQAALPAPFPPPDPRVPAATVEPVPDALLLCEDVVERSGTLRPGVLEDLALAWCRFTSAQCAGPVQSSRRLRVVPETLSVHLSLIESIELVRRTRVIEQPGGVNVQSINALSVPVFMGLDEAVLAPRYLSARTAALSLPLGSPELPGTLSNLASGSHPTLVRLVVSREGRAHGLLTHFSWPEEDKERKADSDHRSLPEEGGKLSGVLWPADGEAEPPLLRVGDTVLVTVRYSPSRGLVFAPEGVERGNKPAEAMEESRA